MDRIYLKVSCRLVKNDPQSPATPLLVPHEKFIEKPFGRVKVF